MKIYIKFLINLFNTSFLKVFFIFFILLSVSFLKLLKINEQFINSRVEFSCVFWCVTVWVVKFEILKSVLENSN